MMCVKDSKFLQCSLVGRFEKYYIAINFVAIPTDIYYIEYWKAILCMYEVFPQVVNVNNKTTIATFKLLSVSSVRLFQALIIPKPL